MRKLVTPPTAEPIEVADAKDQLRLVVSDDDSYVEGLISVAREYVENFTERALLTQTWDVYLDKFPCHQHIELPLPPLQSVTSLKYLDGSGVEQTMDPMLYTVDAVSTPARIMLKPNAFWPLTYVGPNSVIIRMVCGYADAASIPATIKHAIKFLVSHFYENRAPIVITTGVAREIPVAVESLLTTGNKVF